MKTGELIAELKRLDPSGQGEVEVPVGTYTQVYPVAYLKIGYIQQTPFHNPEGNDVRLYVNFPEGYSVAQRRKK